MPTYQYACASCGEQTEVVQKFTDAPLTVCDSCGGSLRKVFSAVGVVFKGSGFYRTDSRASSNGTSGKTTSPNEGPASSTSSASGSSSGSSSSSSSSSSSAA